MSYKARKSEQSSTQMGVQLDATLTVQTQKRFISSKPDSSESLRTKCKQSMAARSGAAAMTKVVSGLHSRHLRQATRTFRLPGRRWQNLFVELLATHSRLSSVARDLLRRRAIKGKGNGDSAIEDRKTGNDKEKGQQRPAWRCQVLPCTLKEVCAAHDALVFFDLFEPCTVRSFPEMVFLVPTAPKWSPQ